MGQSLSLLLAFVGVFFLATLIGMRSNSKFSRLTDRLRERCIVVEYSEYRTLPKVLELAMMFFSHCSFQVVCQCSFSGVLLNPLK